MSKSIRNFAFVAGVLALVPSMASAFHGNLVQCTTTAGVPVLASLTPGLDCNNVLNKIGIKGAKMNNCTANPAAPWASWAAGKFGSKITAGDAALIKQVTIDLKATTFGSCNFAGVADSASAAGAGKLAFLAADGVTKIKGGGAKFFAKVGGDLATQSASSQGLVTKGIGVGSSIGILIGIDLANPLNANVLACNLGFVCPPTIPPSTQLALISDANTSLRIDIQNNADCTGNNAPYPCCTGAGVGNC